MRLHPHTLLFSAALAASCGDLSFPLGPAADATPEASPLPALASAGADIEVLRGVPVSLDGRGTTHPEGRTWFVTWRQTQGEAVFLTPHGSLTPSFVAPLTEQELRFAIVVDDGTWQVSDEVSVFVRNAPSRQAPRVAAGPDRLLRPGDAVAPTAGDVLPGLGDGVETHWEQVVPAPLHSGTVGSQPTIYRLTASRDGLSSAPDYLLLYPYDEDAAPAPAGFIEGPATVLPGQSFSIHATLGSDPREPVWRWEQTRGEPVQLLESSYGVLGLVAPRVPQEISIRVFARDGRLESAPAELRITVTSPVQPPPAVAPGPDQRTRPGRTVLLDALGASADSFEEPPGWVFEWTQTHGVGVELTLSSNGRFASFVAPDAPGELAFVVAARDGEVASAPATTAVSVAAETDNLPPQVCISASSSAPVAGELVEISATILDPEADPVAGCFWDAQQDDGVQTAPIALLPSSSCDPSVAVPAVQFVAPRAGITVTTRMQACDDRGACGEAEVAVTSA